MRFASRSAQREGWRKRMGIEPTLDEASPAEQRF
jgi:hypothetical protein